MDRTALCRGAQLVFINIICPFSVIRFFLFRFLPHAAKLSQFRSSTTHPCRGGLPAPEQRTRLRKGDRHCHPTGWVPVGLSKFRSTPEDARWSFPSYRHFHHIVPAATNRAYYPTYIIDAMALKTGKTPKDDGEKTPRGCRTPVPMHAKKQNGFSLNRNTDRTPDRGRLIRACLIPKILFKLPGVSAGTKADAISSAQRQRNEFLSVTRSHETTVIKRVAHGLGRFFDLLVSQRADWRRATRLIAR